MRRSPLSSLFKDGQLCEGFSALNSSHPVFKFAGGSKVSVKCALLCPNSDVLRDLLWRLQLFNFEALPSLIFHLKALSL